MNRFQRMAAALGICFLGACAGIDGAARGEDSFRGPNVHVSAADAAREAGMVAKRIEDSQRQRFVEVCGPLSGPEFSGAIYELLKGGFVWTEAPQITPGQLLAHNQSALRGLGVVEEIRFRRALGLSEPRRASKPRQPARLVAYWHTHPSSVSFSESDKAFVHATGVPLYLIRNRVLGGGLVEVLRPSAGGRLGSEGSDRGDGAIFASPAPDGGVPASGSPDGGSLAVRRGGSPGAGVNRTR